MFDNEGCQFELGGIPQADRPVVTNEAHWQDVFNRVACSHGRLIPVVILIIHRFYEHSGRRLYAICAVPRPEWLPRSSGQEMRCD
jgi:hypothetical protein